ncbi:armadillo-type protein [Syncephalastrum racemosum]|uniref:Armadillo-type protein n=1 Tax=Syncephalastrum racemosum TaxID=13706 RepID=A0A1X2HT00_SYNRA|nr:armadillo-type protein [Syncephalastrum racemosum]
MINLAAVLANTLSSDDATRSQATQHLETIAAEDFDMFCLLVAQQLTVETLTDPVRMVAALVLKNNISNKSRNDEDNTPWFHMDMNTRNQIKHLTVLALRTQNRAVSSTFAQVAATIAEFEISAGYWPEFIPGLLENVATEDLALKATSLRTLGYLCENMDTKVLGAQSNEILTAVIHGAHSANPSEIQLIALQTLYNCLSFVKANFECEGERNYIMQTVCEATQSSVEDVQVSAFECLSQIMQLYYDKMQFYMERALFELTLAGMKTIEGNVVLQAIEFWSTVCEKECEIKAYILQQFERGEPILVTEQTALYQFAERALPHVFPVLLSLLVKTTEIDDEEEEEDDEDWTVFKAATMCISLFAQCTGNLVITHAFPFIEKRLTLMADRASREAAIMALGAILHGPDKSVLRPIANDLLSTLVREVSDPVPSIQCAAMWTLGRVCEQLPDCIRSASHVRCEFLTALTHNLAGSSKIALASCRCLTRVGAHFQDAFVGDKNLLLMQSYYLDTLNALSSLTDQLSESHETQCRTHAFEALCAFVGNTPMDLTVEIERIQLNLICRIGTTASALFGASMGEKMRKSELLYSQLRLLMACVQKINEHGGRLASDQIMGIICMLLSPIHGVPAVTAEAFLVMRGLIQALGSECYARGYMEPLMAFLCTALQRTDEPQVYQVALLTVGDVCKVSEPQQMYPFWSTLADLLLLGAKQPTALLIRVYTQIVQQTMPEGEYPQLAGFLGALQYAGTAKLTHSKGEEEKPEVIGELLDLRLAVADCYGNLLSAACITQGKDMVVLQILPSLARFLQLVVSCPNRNEMTLNAALVLLENISAMGEMQNMPSEWLLPFLKTTCVDHTLEPTTRARAEKTLAHLKHTYE